MGAGVSDLGGVQRRAGPARAAQGCGCDTKDTTATVRAVCEVCMSRIRLCCILTLPAPIRRVAQLPSCSWRMHVRQVKRTKVWVVCSLVQAATLPMDSWTPTCFSVKLPSKKRRLLMYSTRPCQACVISLTIPDWSPIAACRWLPQGVLQGQASRTAAQRVPVWRCWSVIRLCDIKPHVHHRPFDSQAAV